MSRLFASLAANNSKLSLSHSTSLLRRIHHIVNTLCDDDDDDHIKRVVEKNVEMLNGRMQNNLRQTNKCPAAAAAAVAAAYYLYEL